MGLNSAEPLSHVKREITDEDSEVQWPYMRKVSSVSHFMSLKPGTGQHDVVKKVPSDPATSCFSPTPSAGSIDQSQKSSAGEIQYMLPLQCKSDVKMSISNEALSLSMSDPALPGSGSPGQNLVRSQMRKQPMAISSPGSPMVGYTEPWKRPNTSKAPTQMTIFYAGTVNVYDNISPETAYAIMLLARNGNSVASNMDATHQKPQGQSLDIKAVATGNDGPALQPSSNVFSHKAVSPALQYGIVSSSQDEVACNTGVISSPVSKPEPPRASIGSIPVPATSAVPQFRKASLARFLEKRKERVMNVAPYSCEKKPQEDVSMDSKRNEDSTKIYGSTLSATVNGS